jgi:aryl-alcohol dehydrogenase-like predicted oxidoreductase
VGFAAHTTLGRTKLEVGRLGIASSYRAPAAAYEEAFERGCNYFTWGSFVRGRSAQMRTAMRNIIARGQRDGLVLAMLTYAHSAWLTDLSFSRGLKALGTDYADVLLLGYYSKRPPRRVLDGATRLKEKGLVRYIGVTSHNRQVIPTLAAEGVIDVFHVRYNAAHQGAETDVFPHLGEPRPGIVAFTATRWGKLLDRKSMPPDEAPLTAVDAYRFALSNPSVDVCMSGPKTLEQMRENLALLDSGPLDGAELERIRRIGDWVYGKKRARSSG